MASEQQRAPKAGRRDADGRHSHPGIVVTVITTLTAVVAVQGLVLRVVLDGTREAKAAAVSAKATAELAAEVAGPEARARQASVVPDLDEVTVIAAYCGHVPGNDELDEVRTCVEAEFRAHTGYPPPGGGTTPRPTTTTPGARP